MSHANLDAHMSRSVTFRCGTCDQRSDLPAEDCTLTVSDALDLPRFHAHCPTIRCDGTVEIPVEDLQFDQLLAAGVQLGIR